MLLTRSRLAALGCAAIVALLSPGLALAQAQVEAVPEAPPAFDMWNLEALGDSDIHVPPEILPEPPTSPPTAADASDPCRHFTQEERRLLPSLCGASD
jgi:hypothetical protein